MYNHIRFFRYKSLQVVTNPDFELLGCHVAGGRPGRPDQSVGTDGTDGPKSPLAARAEIQMLRHARNHFSVR